MKSLFNSFFVMATLTSNQWLTADTIFYRATLRSSEVIGNGAQASTDETVGSAKFILDFDAATPSAATLSYEFNLPGFDLDGNQTVDLNDDVTAIHVHDVTQCASPTCIPGDTAGTKHVLNIFGVPRQDDADLTVFPTEERLTGMWDQSDANDLSPAPSTSPGEILPQLENGQVFVMVHSRRFPNGAIGGFLVPEPSSPASALFVFIGLFMIRRKDSLTLNRVQC